MDFKYKRSALMLFAIFVVLISVHYASAVIFDGLAYYPLDNNLSDTFNRNNLANNTGFTFSSVFKVVGSHSGKSDGVNSGVFNDTISGLPFNLSTVKAVSFWTNATAVGTDKIFYQIGTNSATDSQFCWHDGAGNFICRQYRGGTLDWTMTKGSALSTNAWNFVVIVFNGSVEEMWINNALIANGTTGTQPRFNWTEIRIGGTDIAGIGHINAHFDNFFLHNTTLTAANISVMYNAGAGVTMEPMSPIVTDTLNITNLLPANNTQFNTQFLNINATIEHSDDLTCALFVNGTLNQSSNHSSWSYYYNNSNPNILAWYHFDNSTQDSSTNNIDLTAVNGATVSTTGLFAESAYLNGQASFTLASPFGVANASQGSLMAWINTSSLGTGNDRTNSRGVFMDSGGYYGMEITSTGLLGLTYDTGYKTITGGNISINTWTHIAFTWNNTNRSLFVNGELVNSLGAIIPSGSLAAVIGMSGGALNYTGWIDELYVFNRSIFPNDIRSYFNYTANRSQIRTTNVTYNLTFSSTVEQQYNYSLHCDDNRTFENSTARIFYIDNVFPLIRSGFTNHFTAFNGSLLAQFNFTDDFNMFSYDIYLDGNRIDNRTDLNTTNYQLNFTLTTINLSGGAHTLIFNASDGHTSKAIPDFDYSRNIFTKSITYDFDQGWVSIQPIDRGLFDSFNTEKQKDRYSFIHERGSTPSVQRYKVESSDPISIIGDNKYKGWLVIGELGKWIDFESLNKYESLSVKRISSTEVEISIKGLEDELVVFNSIGNLNTITSSYIFFVGNVTTSLTSPVLSTSPQTFTANFIINNSFISDVNATLRWNGTVYTADTKLTSGTSINFTKLLIMPTTDTALSVNVTWNYTIYGVNNTETNLSAIIAQSIVPITVTNCSSTDENATLILIPKDEETDQPLTNVSVGVFLDFYVNSLNVSRINQSFNFRNSQNYSICFNPFNSQYRTNAFIDYETPLYSQRNYFLSEALIGNNRSTILDLFLINSSLDSDVTVQVLDNDGESLVEHFVKVLRRDSDNESFRTVEVGRTNDDGEAITRLILYDVWYKFIIDNGNTTLFTSSVQKISSTSLFFTITSGSSYLETVRDIQGLEQSLIYTNSSGIVLYTYNDVTGIMRRMNLQVKNMSLGGGFICNNQSSSSSGTLSCQINSSSGENYLATVYLTNNNDQTFKSVAQAAINLRKEFENFGSTGILVQLLMLNVMIGLGLWRPGVAIAYGALSIMAGFAMGIIGLTYTVVVIIITILILALGIMRD